MAEKTRIKASESESKGSTSVPTTQEAYEPF